MRPHQPLPETVMVWYRVVSNSCPFKFFQVGCGGNCFYWERILAFCFLSQFVAARWEDATGPLAGKTQLQRSNMSSRQVWAREERRWPRKDKRSNENESRAVSSHGEGLRVLDSLGPDAWVFWGTPKSWENSNSTLMPFSCRRPHAASILVYLSHSHARCLDSVTMWKI